MHSISRSIAKRAPQWCKKWLSLPKDSKVRMNKDDIKFSPALFWDVDAEQMDIDAHPAFVIQRVLERGRWEDWVQIRAYYPMETIISEVMNLRTLSPKALNYISLYTKTNKQEYRCYKLAQLHPTLWNS
jgi:hypothetical protein